MFTKALKNGDDYYYYSRFHVHVHHFYSVPHNYDRNFVKEKHHRFRLKTLSPSLHPTLRCYHLHIQRYIAFTSTLNTTRNTTLSLPLHPVLHRHQPPPCLMLHCHPRNSALRWLTTWPPVGHFTDRCTKSSHSEHRFLASSSKLCQNWLCHWRGTLYLRTAFGYQDCGSNIASKHTRKHGARLPRVKKRKKKKFHLCSNDLGFICTGAINMGGYKRNV